MQKINTKQLVACAVLACIGGILSGPLSFYFMTWKISLGSIAVMLAGILFGPLLGGMTGFASDVINFALAPRGAYNPLFGLTFALMGVIAGYVYRHKDDEIIPSIPRTAITAGACQIICSFLLNTSIMVFMYGATPALFVTKIVYNVTMIFVSAAVLHIILTSVIVTRMKLNKA